MLDCFKMKLQSLKRFVQFHGSSFTLTIPKWWVEQHEVESKDGFSLIAGECLVYVPKHIDPKKILCKLKKGGLK